MELSAGGTRASVAAVAGQWNTAVRTPTGVSEGRGGEDPAEASQEACTWPGWDLEPAVLPAHL